MSAVLGAVLGGGAFITVYLLVKANRGTSEGHRRQRSQQDKEGRDHDTVDGLAQRTLAAIHAEVERLIAAELEACRAECIDVNLDAQNAAAKSDVSHYDSDSYAAGYMDAAIDCYEAIRQRSNFEGEALPTTDKG